MIDENRSRTALTATINTTEDCNLRCRYCYETNKKPRVMRFETAARFLELLLEEDDPVLDESEGSLYGVERGITLDFIGGDALSNPELLDAILSFWVQALFRSRSYNARFWRDNWRVSISTNGTLFSRPEVRAFCEKWRAVLSVGVSIDGCPEIHDKNRVFPDGSPSMPEILKNWEWYRKTFPSDSLSTKATCSRDSIPYLLESLRFMHETLGLRYIRQNFVMENAGYTEADAAHLAEELARCADYVFDHRKSLYWSMLDRGTFAEHHRTQGADWERKGHCGSGGMPALSIDGDIYPCFRWLPHSQGEAAKRFICGNVRDGFTNKEAFRQVRQGAYRAACTTDEACRACEYESACPYCIAGCFAEFGAFKRQTYVCGIIKAQCEAAKQYWKRYEEAEGDAK